MSSISSEAKVGIFVLIGLIILAYMSFQAGQKGLGLRKGYLVNVTFDNVSGLERDASVQIAGVDMGRVEKIALINGRALVTLRISPNVKLEKDVKAAIKTHGVLGDKYIELVPGTSGVAHIPEGGEITQVERQADLDKLLNQIGLIADDIKQVTGSLSTVLGGKEGQGSIKDILENTRRLTHNLNMVVKSNEETLRVVLENIKQLTENLNNVVVKNDEKMAQTIENLKGASREMEKTFASLSEITDSIKKGEGTVGQLVKDKDMAVKLTQTIDSLKDVADKINQGKGSIGKLINDEETVNNLNEGLAGINRYVSKAEQYRTFLNYRGEYLFDRSEAKNYLDIKIQPNQDKFYLIGLVSDPKGKLKTRDTTVGGVTTRTEEWDRDGLLFNAQIGKRYKDVIIRGGLLESTGGVGLDYMAFNDKLKFSFEAFDFSTDNKTHLKASAEYQLFKHLYLTAGWDDFIGKKGSKSPFAGIAIRFEDDDLKYLLTTTPIPK
ncbi:MAG: MCE family protein [Deltaproteobacteria bacterium]|nr:MCE family protein [Deltaproteobacteria bacterium]